MNPDFTIEDVISRIGEESAFRFFVYTTEEFPLDPRGWDGMAHLAHFYGDLDRAIAYLEHSRFLASGIAYPPSQGNSESVPPGNTASAPTTTAGKSEHNGCALVAKVVFGFGAFCCIWLALCNRPSTSNQVVTQPTASSIESRPSAPDNQGQTSSNPEPQRDVPLTAPETNFQRMTMFELDCTRNEPFAKRGYRFKRRDLREYFERLPWYKATTNDQDRIWRELSDDERTTILKVKTEQMRRSNR
jgi:hypothetical protein